ncbi:hypothetical protein [Burkholderia vietnamiensis]|uniref:hypothetical protein n=1 Tax=Burkholderia vietnamiensis TaxID=60552 RepID=UPI001CC425D0|nr:hypothetical protein [Burkholderia vietnamiensis]
MPRIDATATLSQPTRDASRESLSDRHRIATGSPVRMNVATRIPQRSGSLFVVIRMRSSAHRFMDEPRRTIAIFDYSWMKRANDLLAQKIARRV